MKEKIIPAIYIGKRLSAKGNLVQVFLVGKQKFHFKNIGWLSVGRRYPLFDRGKNEHQMARNPDPMDDWRAPQEKIDRWYAEETIAEQEVKRIRVDKIIGGGKFKAIADQLAPLLTGLSWSQRRTVMDFLADNSTTIRREK